MEAWLSARRMQQGSGCVGECCIDRRNAGAAGVGQRVGVVPMESACKPTPLMCWMP